MTDCLPSDRELEALKILWSRGQATVREIWEALKQEGNDLAYTTVLSLMQVMEQKGLVGHKRVGKAYTYFSHVPRDRTFRELAAQFLDRVFDGALDEYLVHALESRRLTVEQIDRLEEMISQTKSRSLDRGKKKRS